MRLLTAWRAGLLLGASPALFSCSTVSYLLQAGKGQLELFNRARPLDEVLKDERTSPRLKALLAEVPRVKAFGETMGLKATSNYSEYVALDRPDVVTVIAACEELAFRPKVWSFPIVGSFPYLGFFDEKMARKWAGRMRDRGYDVEVRGANAYSTLGWFSDPILSSMIPEGEHALGELVDVVIHESVHATHYVDDQSFYNESLASFIAEGLTTQYLKQTLGKGSAEERAYRADLARSREVQHGLHETYRTLEKLYASDAPAETKRAEKRRILDAARARLRIRREVNNATLIQFKTYRSGAESFQGVHERCGKDWSRTLRALFQLDARHFSGEQVEELEPVLAQAVCPPN